MGRSWVARLLSSLCRCFGAHSFHLWGSDWLGWMRLSCVPYPPTRKSILETSAHAGIVEGFALLLSPRVFQTFPGPFSRESSQWFFREGRHSQIYQNVLFCWSGFLFYDRGILVRRGTVDVHLTHSMTRTLCCSWFYWVMRSCEGQKAGQELS